MSYYDRYSQFGDSRIDDYWYHRYRQIDVEYAVHESAARSRLERWEVEALRPTAADLEHDLDEPSTPSLTAAVDEILDRVERARKAIGDHDGLDQRDRDHWLARLSAIDLFGRAAFDELNELQHDVQRFSDVPGVRVSVTKVTTQLALLAWACQDFHLTE